MSRSLRLRALACATLLAVVLSTVVAPLAAFAIDDVSSSTLVTLPVPSGQKARGSSDGDIVVWDNADSDTIGGCDNATKRSIQVPSTPGWRASNPKISGSRVIYQARYHKVGYYETDIWGYDLSTESTFVVCADPGDQTNYAIDGDIVVWAEGGDSDSSYIRGKNLSTGEYFEVPHPTGMQMNADVAGDWVVFDNGTDVKAYNVVTKTLKSLCSWAGDQYYARISKTGFVVWQSVTDPARPNATMDLYGCNVNDGVIRKIAGGYGAQHSPTIGGNIITWMDDSKPGGYGLVGYDLLSNTRFGISKSVAWYYYIAGIENGTIARLYTDYSVRPLNTKVQLFYPTELDVISSADGAEESVASGDEAIQGEESGFPTALRVASRVETVVVAPSASWTSSTLACSLAGKRYPLLLVGSTSISDAALSKLAGYGSPKVVVAGSPGALSQTAFSQLASVVGTDSISFLEGVDTTARSIGVARTLAGRTGFKGTVIVCAASSAAMMAIPASVSKGVPIVIVGSRGLTASQVAMLKAAGAKKFAVVGTGVPSLTLSRLRRSVGTTNVRVILGTTIAGTSTSFASWAISTLGLHWNGLAIASKSNWTHTPMAALSRGRADSVVLLTDSLTLSSPVKTSLVVHHRSIRRASFVGSRSIVSNTVRRQVRLAIK